MKKLALILSSYLFFGMVNCQDLELYNQIQREQLDLYELYNFQSIEVNKPVDLTINESDDEYCFEVLLMTYVNQEEQIEGTPSLYYFYLSDLPENTHFGIQVVQARYNNNLLEDPIEIYNTRTYPLFITESDFYYIRVYSQNGSHSDDPFTFLIARGDPYEPNDYVAEYWNLQDDEGLHNENSLIGATIHFETDRDYYVFSFTNEDYLYELLLENANTLDRHYQLKVYKVESSYDSFPEDGMEIDLSTNPYLEGDDSIIPTYYVVCVYSEKGYDPEEYYWLSIDKHLK